MWQVCGGKGGSYMVLMWKLEGKSQFKLPRRGCKDTVTSYLKEIVWVKVE